MLVQSQRRRLAREALAAVLMALAAVVAAPAAESASAHSIRRTSLAASIPPPVPPYQPGDQVWTTHPPPVVLAPLGSGCQRVPSTGYISSGVYAQTTSEYSNYWNWSDASAAQPFHWYVFTSGGTLKSNGPSPGTGGATTVPANANYWKVQNQGSVPQAWNVCWSG